MIKPRKQDTGWRALALAEHLAELLNASEEDWYEIPGEPGFQRKEAEKPRRVDRRKSTFFVHTDDSRQYRVSVHEWRERPVE